ncbi:unnamed protein product, partial [Hapterophycus canaliculatus]
KDVLISGLLNRDLNPAFNHIRGLKDIVECKLTPNPAFGKEDRAFDGPEPARYMCPVTLQEMNGSHSFVVLMSTGWVMAEKATKEVGISGLQEEYGPFTEDDVVRLAPTDEEREVVKRQLISKREQARLAKKASKKSARRGKEQAAPTVAVTALGAGAATSPSSSSPKNSATAGGIIDADNDVKSSAKKGDGDASSGERKKNKRRRRAAEKDAAVAAAIAAKGASAGPNSARLAGAAAEAVKKNKEESKVYASLFGKKDVSNEHLFIATAGHRYNLG